MTEEIERTIIIRIAMDAIAPAMRNDRSPRLNVCGTGPIRSIWLLPMNARTELVPRINMIAMIGAATTTDEDLVRRLPLPLAQLIEISGRLTGGIESRRRRPGLAGRSAETCERRNSSAILKQIHARLLDRRYDRHI